MQASVITYPKFASQEPARVEGSSLLQAAKGSASANEFGFHFLETGESLTRSCRQTILLSLTASGQTGLPTMKQPEEISSPILQFRERDRDRLSRSTIGTEQI